MESVDRVPAGSFGHPLDHVQLSTTKPNRIQSNTTESPLPTMEAPTAPMGGISSSSSRRPAPRRRRCSPAAAPLTAAALALAAALAGAPSARAFPAYDNPILAAPALVRPGALLCQVEFITNAACDGYEKVVTQPFAPPGNNPECRGWVSKVVLDFHGAVKGVQFDRCVTCTYAGV